MMTPEIEAALLDIEAEHGTVTPELVVAAARSRTSVLHGHFTWDDREAGYKYRLIEARSLLRMRVLVTTTQFTTVNVPAFLRDPRAEGAQQGYVSLGRLQNDDELANQAMITELMRAYAALSRAQAIAIALDQRDEIEGMLREVLQLVGRARQDGETVN